MTYRQLQKETLEREVKIREMYPNAELITVWECRVERMIKDRHHAEYDPEMKKFFDEEHDTATFLPSDCLYGGKILREEFLDNNFFEFVGRTQPFALYCESDDEFVVMYLDFDSLYPSINFEGLYMMGHPVPRTWYMDVQWDKAFLDTHGHLLDPITQEILRGFLKVKFNPPRELEIPVTSGLHKYNKNLVRSLSRPGSFTLSLVP